MATFNFLMKENKSKEAIDIYKHLYHIGDGSTKKKNLYQIPTLAYQISALTKKKPMYLRIN